VVSSTPQPQFTAGKDWVPIVQEAGWAPGPVWTGAENLSPTGIRSPERPARSSVAIPTEIPGPQLTIKKEKSLLHAGMAAPQIFRYGASFLISLTPVTF
jgi:hypothetical protein